MATQPPPPPPRNGESIQFALGGKSVAITAGNLIPILLLLLMGVGGYLLYISVDHRLEAILAGQAQLQGISSANKDAVIDALHDHRSFIVEVVNQGQRRQEQQAEVLQRLLIILDLPPEILGGRTPLKPPVGP